MTDQLVPILQIVLPRKQETEAETRLYRGMGRSLAVWQFVEYSMFFLFMYLNNQNYETDSADFFNEFKTSEKIKKINKRLSENTKYTKFLDRWRSIKHDLNSINDFRNAVAHFEVLYIFDDQKEILKTSHNVIVATNTMNLPRIKNKGHECLTIENIENNIEETFNMSYKLLYFFFDIIEDIEDFSKKLPLERREWMTALYFAPRLNVR